MTDIKFCGLTRSEDARYAADLGARYVGVILTASPRRVTANQAWQLFSTLPESVTRVGVFGAEPAAEIASLASASGVNVVQLHGDQTSDAVGQVRSSWPGRVWWVARVDGGRMPDVTFDIASLVDAVLLDARVAGRLGGTGQALDWAGLVPAIERLRSIVPRIVLAGGLTADNVRQAVSALHPDVVDVSSGVESAPGVKDHERMRAFRDAVRNGAPR